MTVRIEQITATNWSPLIGTPGEVVTDYADIDQCIAIIITTRKGSDPHRPLFGCDAWLWLDKPSSIAVPNVIREVVDALELWEPRIVVTGVAAAINAEGQATITIEWRPIDAATIITTEVPIATAG